MIPVTNTAATSARRALDRVDHEIAALAQWSDSEAACAMVRPVVSAWSGLLSALALGPEPQTRSCPFCGETGMRAATRCGFCWRKLTPLLDTEGKDTTPSGNRSSQAQP